MVILLAAALTAVAVLVLGLSPARIRGRGPARGEDRAAPRSWTHPDSPRPARAPRVASAVAGLALWALLGGVTGVLAGVAAVLLGPPLLGRLETESRRRERLALLAGAPLVADLLAAALVAGVPIDRAVPVIARALGSPVGDALELVAAHVRVGEAPDHAWSRVADTPGLGAIATTVARSARSGAPLAGMLVDTADDLRAQAAATALAEVRATSVRAVLPLGLCLLPAFVLLGILPVVAGLIAEL